MATHKPVEVDSLFGELEISKSDEKWTVIHTKLKREKKLASYLKEKGIYYFLPLNNSERHYKYRKINFTKPLFPGYMFALLDEKKKREIVVSGHIANFLKTTSEKELLEDLKRIYISFIKGAVFEHHPFVEVGKRVKIISGPFVGLTGMVTESENKVVLQIRFLRKAVSITVEPNQIEIIN